MTHSFKKAVVLFCVTSTLSLAVQAKPDQASVDPLVNMAYDMANLVQSHSAFLSAAQRAAVHTALTEVYTAVQGNIQPELDLDCVSRDNDGSNPWMMATRSGVNMTRIPGTVFSQKASCEAAIASIQYKVGTNFLCASRDNDGSRPYVLGILDVFSPIYKNLNKTFIFSSLEDCLQALNDSKVSQNGMTLCSSRDNDGSRPYVQYFLDKNQNIQKGNETFSSYESCKTEL